MQKVEIPAASCCSVSAKENYIKVLRLDDCPPGCPDIGASWIRLDVGSVKFYEILAVGAEPSYKQNLSFAPFWIRVSSSKDRSA